jgi:hypothetical protein
MRDLRGNEISVEEARSMLARDRKRRPTPKARGYAAMPGTGPAGETCRSCKHLHRKSRSKTYLKCALMRQFWTGGTGSDVRASSPACRQWERGGET